MLLIRSSDTSLLFCLVLLMQLGDATSYFRVELGTFDLIENGSVIGFVNAERLSAVGANEFVHKQKASKGMLSFDIAKVCIMCAIYLRNYFPSFDTNDCFSP